MELLFRCMNCDGAHQAYSKSCPMWQTEKEVLRVKHTQNISFPDARRQVEALTKHKTSYAATVKQPITQTEKTKTATQTEKKNIQNSIGKTIKPTTTITSKSDRWWNLGPLVESSSLARVTTPSTTEI